MGFFFILVTPILFLATPILFLVTLILLTFFLNIRINIFYFLSKFALSLCILSFFIGSRSIDSGYIITITDNFRFVMLFLVLFFSISQDIVILRNHSHRGEGTSLSERSETKRSPFLSEGGFMIKDNFHILWGISENDSNTRDVNSNMDSVPFRNFCHKG